MTQSEPYRVNQYFPWPLFPPHSTPSSTNSQVSQPTHASVVTWISPLCQRSFPDQKQLFSKFSVRDVRCLNWLESGDREKNTAPSFLWFWTRSFPVCCYSASSRVDISWLLFQFNYSLSSLLHHSSLDKENRGGGGNNRLNPPSSHLAVGKVWPAPPIPSAVLIPDWNTWA